MEIPKGYEAQVRARSGLAIKNGIGLVNGIGTADSDYRGEPYGTSDQLRTGAFYRRKRSADCAGCDCTVYKADLELAETLDETCRGAQGVRTYR